MEERHWWQTEKNLSRRSHGDLIRRLFFIKFIKLTIINWIREERLECLRMDSKSLEVVVDSKSLHTV